MHTDGHSGILGTLAGPQTLSGALTLSHFYSRGPEATHLCTESSRLDGSALGV
jgi:hypothetical protein